MNQKLITVEDLLIWAYRDQCVGRGAGMEAAEMAADGRHRIGNTMTGKIMEMRELGCTVDGGGGGSMGRVAEDALTVEQHVMRLPGKVRGRVIHHARTGSRPDWLPEVEPYRLVPKRDASGRYEVWTKPRQGDSYNRNTWVAGVTSDPMNSWVRQCDLAFAGTDPDLVAKAECVWSQWFDALWDLTKRLSWSGELKAHKITGVGVPEQPWMAGRVSRGVDKVQSP